MNQNCTLPPSGNIETTQSVEDWVTVTAANLRQADVAPFVARVWPYRVGAANFITCDIDGSKRSGESITFKIGGHHDLNKLEPTVPDAAEALHMIALLTRNIGAELQLGR